MSCLTKKYHQLHCMCQSINLIHFLFSLFKHIILIWPLFSIYCLLLNIHKIVEILFFFIYFMHFFVFVVFFCFHVHFFCKQCDYLKNKRTPSFIIYSIPLFIYVQLKSLFLASWQNLSYAVYILNMSKGVHF